MNICKIPLKHLNRHGLIAGAELEKTKTIQVLSEQLSSFRLVMMDMVILAVSPRRRRKILLPKGMPNQYIMASKLCAIKQGTTARDCFEFGPVLFSQILGLNDTSWRNFSNI
jgi:hypothetical protein